MARGQLERDPALYPTYTGQIGALMREETQTFLEHEIFARRDQPWGRITVYVDDRVVVCAAERYRH